MWIENAADELPLPLDHCPGIGRIVEKANDAMREVGRVFRARQLGRFPWLDDLAQERQVAGDQRDARRQRLEQQTGVGRLAHGEPIGQDENVAPSDEAADR
jgi:hypothetical protein